MNNLNIWVIILSLLVVTVVNSASLTIPKTFVAGKKAVAKEVNDNFKAVKISVDDNDSKIKTLETNEGINKTDIDTNNTKITTLEAKVSTLETGAVSVDARAFHRTITTPNRCNWQTNNSYGYFSNTSTSNLCDVSASIQIPDKVTIKALICFFSDNVMTVPVTSGSTGLKAILYRKTLSGSTSTANFSTAIYETVTTNGASPSAIFTLTDNTPKTIGDAVVNNTQFAYSIKIDFPDGTTAVGLNAKLYGCRITYE